MTISSLQPWPRGVSKEGHCWEEWAWGGVSLGSDIIVLTHQVS